MAEISSAAFRCPVKRVLIIDEYGEKEKKTVYVFFIIVRKHNGNEEGPSGW